MPVVLEINDDTTMKLVVTILSDMHLTEAETSVLRKGLTFMPLNARSDEFQAKSDCVQFFRRLRLKAHFHGRESVSYTSENDPFSKFRLKVSSWTPTEGRFSSLDHYIDKCRRAKTKSISRKKANSATCPRRREKPGLASGSATISSSNLLIRVVR